MLIMVSLKEEKQSHLEEIVQARGRKIVEASKTTTMLKVTM